jgi:hypothetical protein
MANSKALRIKNTDAEIAQNPQSLNFTGGLTASYDGVGEVDVQLATNGLAITNDSTDNTISIDQNGNVGTNVATDGALHIENTGNTGIGLAVFTDMGASSDAELVSIKAENSAFDQTVVRIANDGSGVPLYVVNAGASFGIRVDQSGAGASLRLNHTGNRAHINFTGDPTPPSPTDGDFWFDGTNLKIRIGATTYNVDVTAA